MDLMKDQSGVVSRRQLAEAGFAEHEIRRLIRGRRLTTVHPGVYIDHNGPPTWLQRAWAAVLATAPSALCDESALRAAHGPGRRIPREDPIHVAVERMRHVVTPAGVVVHRMAGLTERVNWNLGPPRVNYEDAVLDVAIRQHRRLDAIGVLSEAVGDRRTTAGRLRAKLQARARVPMRDWLSAVLADIGAGAWSVLEQGYLDQVERPHGLPAGRRQLRAVDGASARYRDVDLGGLAVIELDGRLYHSSAGQRDRDLERDLDVAIEGRAALRLGWGQVFERPCQTAAKVGLVLSRHGWTGVPRSCSPDCRAIQGV